MAQVSSSNVPTQPSQETESLQMGVENRVFAMGKILGPVLLGLLIIILFELIKAYAG